MSLALATPFKNIGHGLGFSVPHKKDISSQLDGRTKMLDAESSK
jgi:hypothetical protein